MDKKKISKRTNFISQGSIGGYVAIICYLLGLIRMILFLNKVGDEGIANYAYAFELYQILYLIGAYAIAKTVTKMTAMRQSKGQHKNKKRVFQYGLFRVFLCSVVIGCILFFASDWIAAELMVQNNVSLALKCLGIALIPAGIGAVCSGYLKGMGLGMPVYVAQVIEQVINLIVTVCLAGVLFGYGSRVSALLCDQAKENAFGSAAGALGVLAGAFFSLLFVVFILFLLRKTSQKQYLADTGKSVETYQKVASATELMTAFQLFSLLMATGAVFVNQILYFHIVVGGRSGVKSVGYYGVYYGKVRLFLYFPLVLSFIMETVLAGQLRRILKKDDVTHAKQRIEQSLKELMILLIPIAVYIGVMAEPLFNLFFKGQVKIAVSMMRPGAICIVLFGILGITTAALQGMEKSRMIYISQAAAFLAEVLSFAFVFVNGKTPVMGLIYAMITGAVLQIAIQVAYLVQKLHYRPELVSTFAIPIVLAGVTGLIDYLLVRFAGDLLGEFFTLVIGLILTCLIYMIGILFTKILREHELLELPFGFLWVKLGKLLGIL